MVAKPPRVLTCPNVTHDLILTVLGVAGRFKLPGGGIKKHRTVHIRSTCETRVSTFPNPAAPLYKPPADLRAGAVQFSSALPHKKKENSVTSSIVFRQATFGYPDDLSPVLPLPLLFYPPSQTKKKKKFPQIILSRVLSPRSLGLRIYRRGFLEICVFSL